MISPVKVWRNQSYIAKHIGKRGKIISFTIIRVGPTGFESQIPYPVGVIEFSSHERMVGQIVDWNQEDLHMGCEVEAVLRRVREVHEESVIPYGIKFRPIKSASRS